ncbi:hypothetical protein [Desulfoluna spongiiphila]|uniref:hypothetical protein n=1 Tax=Desulfoluna spongiiphila TaxID=419481 RepID=UPI00111371FC|nr:hypothetical protein [Desulfoluna spongiiphila]
MIKKPVNPIVAAGAIAVLLIFLPLLGAWLNGSPLLPYLSLTSIPEYIPPAPFSPTAFVCLVILLTLTLAPFLRHLVRFQGSVARQKKTPLGTLPWWGRLGILLLLGSWVLAWTRFPWFEPFQAHTFEPLWLSFILVANGYTHKRTGRSLLTHEPVALLCLFVASALFWWFFEYLNRFATNWYYYRGPGEPIALKAYASLAFSTVLPGIASTCDLLASFPRTRAGMDRFVKIDVHGNPFSPWLMILLSCAVLMGIGIRPDLLFPALWVCPLLLGVAGQHLAGYETIFSPLKTGDWTQPWLMAVSALACGFLWELWNALSLSHWEYAIPYVGRFHLFEMPILGYGGYLPFGLECAVICDGVRRLAKKGGRP